MIKKITVNNFRCFSKTVVESLRQTNLFTGKNNAGKTSLLEAIYAITERQIINNTVLIRRIGQHELSAEEIFDNLTYRKNGEPIEIEVVFENYQYAYSKFVYKKPGEFNFMIASHDDQVSHANPDRNFTSVFLLERKEQIPALDNITSLYDKAEISGMKNIFLEAVKIIDEDIVELRTFSSFKNALFFKKKNDTAYYLIDYLGDASKKIITIIANIVFFFLRESSHEKILIIDEIENGLHYSVQEDFWKILISLCIKYNIQLFATTHSKEMLEAYCKVSNDVNYKDAQAYFELVKNYEDKIICINHNMDLLEYELQKNENVRG